MHSFKVSPIITWLVIIGAVIMLGNTVYTYIIDDKTTIVFCNIGQGDATYIRINNRIDVLVDAGPNDQVLSCLGKYMPFFDRTIEVVFLSHPHLDHYGGFIEILDRYTIRKFFKTDRDIDSTYYNKLIKGLNAKGTTISPLYQGDVLRIMDAQITTFWPQKSFVDRSSQKDDLNALSQVFIFRQRNGSILFTGDINPDMQNRLLQQPISNVQILKVPHHGSTKGLTYEFLNLADPVYSVISSGKGNKFRHPHPEIIKMLNDFGTIIKRTDEGNDIVFKI